MNICTNTAFCLKAPVDSSSNISTVENDNYLITVFKNFSNI